jgi:FMN phosphatase YigB (HAD superfamily)
MIHIGDHIEHDVMGANNAGWHSIWFNPKKILNTQGQQPSKIVQCLSEIPQAILAIEEKLKSD